jgi:multidrug resistance efflux pump
MDTKLGYGSSSRFGAGGQLEIRRPVDRIDSQHSLERRPLVNGHVTFVAARVSGQIARVLVDNNNHVHKVDVLAQLDKEPYEDEVAVKPAAVDTAKAVLQVAAAQVHALEARTRSLRWKLQYAIQDVDNRMAVLRARVAALAKSKATLKLAQLDFARAEKLLPDATISQQEYDRGKPPCRLRKRKCRKRSRTYIKSASLWGCQRSQ